MLTMRLVISVDLSPTGGMLATGSGDWSARLCGVFLRLLLQCLLISDVFFRELR